MWSTLKISSGAQLGHDKRDIPAFDTVLFHSNLSSLRRKYLSDVPKNKIVLSSGLKISKRRLKRRYWWLKNKERKCHFRFVERRFLAAINCTGSAEGALVPVFLRITHWTKTGLPVSPPGLFPPWLERRANARHVSFRISLRWLTYIVNSVDKTKLSSQKTSTLTATELAIHLGQWSSVRQKLATKVVKTELN